jgi:hypothetical protein
MTTLPTNHDSSALEHFGKYYEPRRAKESDTKEVERRRAQAGTGALILEHQLGGFGLLKHMIENTRDPHDRGHIARRGSGILLATAPLLFRGTDNEIRMRRVLKYAQVADETGWRQDPDAYEARLLASLDASIGITAELADLKRNRQPWQRTSREAARLIGNTGLMLGMFPLPAFTDRDKAQNIMLMVRQSALTAESQALQLGQRIGVAPTAALLSDPLGPLSFDIQNSEPEAYASAYQDALRLAA